MGVDGAPGDEQALGDLRVGQPLGDELVDLAFGAG
jgi:hypothetical protein